MVEQIIESLKIPKYLLQIYKQVYEQHFNQQLDNDVIVLPKNPSKIYDINISNLIICY